MLEPVERLGVVGASLRGKGVRLREESPQAAWRVSERHVPSFTASGHLQYGSSRTWAGPRWRLVSLGMPPGATAGCAAQGCARRAARKDEAGCPGGQGNRRNTGRDRPGSLLLSSWLSQPRSCGLTAPTRAPLVLVSTPGHSPPQPAVHSSLSSPARPSLGNRTDFSGSGC